MSLTSLGDDELGLASRPETALWPGGRVPYELPANMEHQQEWATMVQEWARAGIRWEPRQPADKEYVRVIIGARVPTACGTAYLGKIPEKAYAQIGGSGQPLWLMSRAEMAELAKRGGSCDILRTIIHEAGHTLGFLHEHMRSDRDQYVIFATNVLVSDSNFGKVEGSKNYIAYDFDSIMHYGTNQTGTPNMRKKNGGVIIANSKGLSAGDLAGARAAYSMVPASPATPTTPASTPAPTAAPRTSVSPKPAAPRTSVSRKPAVTPRATSTPRPGGGAQEGRCLVVGGGQNQLFSGQSNRAECENRCQSFAANEQRRCSWDGRVFRAHPEARCVVRGGGGKELANLNGVTLSICQARCDSFEKANPRRTCDWGSRRLK